MKAVVSCTPIVVGGTLAIPRGCSITQEPDFGVASINYALDELLEKVE